MAAVRHHEYEERIRNAHIVFRSAQQHSIGAAAAAGKVPTYFGLVDEQLGPPGKKAKIIKSSDMLNFLLYMKMRMKKVV